MRKQFALPEDDKEQLDHIGLEWETVRDGGGLWLLLHKFDFPPGYNHASGSVAIQIPNNYPVAQLDMAYFFPHLARTDKQPIRQADGAATLLPSVWRTTGCKSHFIIYKGRLIWCSSDYWGNDDAPDFED